MSSTLLLSTTLRHGCPIKPHRAVALPAASFNGILSDIALRRDVRKNPLHFQRITSAGRSFKETRRRGRKPCGGDGGSRRNARGGRKGLAGRPGVRVT